MPWALLVPWWTVCCAPFSYIASSASPTYVACAQRRQVVPLAGARCLEREQPRDLPCPAMHGGALCGNPTQSIHSVEQHASGYAYCRALFYWYCLGYPNWSFLDYRLNSAARSTKFMQTFYGVSY